MPPKLSVIMSVLNGESHIRQAVDSILFQTFRDFEFIILNDGSTDATKTILDSYQDERLKVLNFVNNAGIAKRVNAGLEMALGEYIARMDADDISLPERLEKQVKFLDEHPEIGICGTWVELIGDRSGEVWRYPEGHDAICALMLFNSPIANPTVMMRATALKQNNLEYMTNCLHGEEDYDLWSRALPHVRFANIPEVLGKYRVQAMSISHSKKQQLRENIKKVIYPRLLGYLGLEFSLHDLNLHQQISFFEFESKLWFLEEVRHWLEGLADANRRVGLIDPATLEIELGRRWSLACHCYRGPLIRLIQHVVNSPLPFDRRRGIMKVLYLLLLILRRFLKSKKGG